MDPGPQIHPWKVDLIEKNHAKSTIGGHYRKVDLIEKNHAKSTIGGHQRILDQDHKDKAESRNSKPTPETLK